MKPKVMHQQAMELSFMAKQAQSESNFGLAIKYYEEAAEIESQVAEFYFDKPELEPTRSVLIRSAAYMNLKAGLVENAQKFIFFGILHCEDLQIKKQLYDALELSMSLKGMGNEEVANEFNYIRLLRQRSVHYVLEPSEVKFGHSVSLFMIKHFVDGYLRSLKAFGVSKLRNVLDFVEGTNDEMEKEFEGLINPLITQSSYGSFKFSLANDFMSRPGEKKEVVDLKSNIILSYHNDIFTNPLTNDSIEELKSQFNSEELNQIFRPLIQIKANTTPYKIAYFDTENFTKKFTSKIVNKQKTKLITPKLISQEDIGKLENSIVHKRSSRDGKISKKTLIREELKAYEMDSTLSQIEPENFSPIILVEPILVNVVFSSDIGFTVSFDDFNIECSEIEYHKAFSKFHNEFYSKILHLLHEEDKNEIELREWEVIRKLISNPEALK